MHDGYFVYMVVYIDVLEVGGQFIRAQAQWPNC